LQPKRLHEPVRHRLGPRGAKIRIERASPPALLRAQDGLAPDQRLCGRQ
jgi:hypothetical protein